ncbi:hypothetical protein [Nocardia lijiangensis]|uniref:hypothetical protein n=1 Tax=Nocardia lijiangensis TaxID=299618 RepID=UPI00083271EA|nr:hypothetical protein [Nocardia lijiangensis]
MLQIVAEHGVEMRYQPMTEAEIGWVVELYGEGKSLNAVARVAAGSWNKPSPCSTSTDAWPSGGNAAPTSTTDS